jgi:Na+-driven multidrug efflux pump
MIMFCSRETSLIFLVMQGIWAGMLIGTVLQTIILFIILVRTRWQKEVKLVARFKVLVETLEI